MGHLDIVPTVITVHAVLWDLKYTKNRVNLFDAPTSLFVFLIPYTTKVSSLGCYLLQTKTEKQAKSLSVSLLFLYSHIGTKKK